MVAHHLGAEIAAHPRQVVGRAGGTVEPHPGRRRQRQHRGADAVLVHRLDVLRGRPRQLHAEMRNLARILPIGPGFLIGRRIKMMMGVDQLARRGLRRRLFAGQQRRGADGRGAGEKRPARDAAAACGRETVRAFWRGHGVLPAFSPPILHRQRHNWNATSAASMMPAPSPWTGVITSPSMSALSTVATSGSRFMISALRNGPMRVVEIYSVKTATAVQTLTTATATQP